MNNIPGTPETVKTSTEVVRDPEKSCRVCKKKKSLISEQDIIKKIDLRNKARENKDYKEADRIRSELLDKGVLIEDKDGKTLWKFK